MKISIITATFNSGSTVRDTLESVLKQSYKDYELIIKDGGSKDDTLAICLEYEPKFEGRMHILTNPDRGIYDAMNQGISAATGDVVGILNSDDFYSNEHVLSTIAAAFEKQQELDAVYADVIYVDWNDTSKLIRYYSSKVFSRGLMRLGFMPAHPTFYCRKSTYEKFALDYSDEKAIRTRKIFRCAQDDKKRYYFDTTYKIAADFENLLRMIFVGRIKTRYIPQQFVTMRAGGASSSGMASHQQIERDHRRAFRENGVYSNILFVALRYAYKIGELLLGKIKS